MNMKEYAFGIDLGGTTAKVGLFTTAGALLEKWEVPTDTSNAGEHILGILAKAVKDKMQENGITAEQARANAEVIRERGAAVGFTFDPDRRSRVWNTFDAHRLLHWAELQGPAQQLALKKALLKSYLTDGENPSDPEVLVRLAGEAGLDRDQARDILATDACADATRRREKQFLDAGIRSVPAIILDRQHLVSGGQPVEVFERALREVAGLASAPLQG